MIIDRPRGHLGVTVYKRYLSDRMRSWEQEGNGRAALQLSWGYRGQEKARMSRGDGKRSRAECRSDASADMKRTLPGGVPCSICCGKLS